MELRGPHSFALVAMIVFMAGGLCAEEIDFEDLVHGEEVDTQYQSSHGVTFSADNQGGGPDALAIFDTTETDTADPDLEGPPNTDWEGGNLAPDTEAGNVFIIQENSTDDNNDGIFDNPDDQAGGGVITVEFDQQLLDFGFNFIDSEEVGEMAFLQGSTEIEVIDFAAFTDPTSQWYDSTIEYGDHYANEMPTVTSNELGSTFDIVEFRLTGSGGFDLIRFTPVPEPSSALFLILACLSALLGRRPRRR